MVVVVVAPLYQMVKKNLDDVAVLQAYSIVVDNNGDKFRCRLAYLAPVVVVVSSAAASLFAVFPVRLDASKTPYFSPTRGLSSTTTDLCKKAMIEVHRMHSDQHHTRLLQKVVVGRMALHMVVVA